MLRLITEQPICRERSGVYNACDDERCCALATHQEFPDEISPHKVIEYNYSLEYTRGN